MMNNNKSLGRIAVIGAGAWGTAIANLIAKNFANVLKNPICLIANDAQVINEINNHHSNSQFLPKVKLSNNIKACGNLENEIKNIDLVFIVTPSQTILQVKWLQRRQPLLP